MGFSFKKAFRIPKKIRKWKPLKKPAGLIIGAAALALPFAAPGLLAAAGKGALVVGKGALAAGKYGGVALARGARGAARGAVGAAEMLQEYEAGGGYQEMPETPTAPAPFSYREADPMTSTPETAPAPFEVSPAMLAVGIVALVLLVRK